ncbi:MAG: 2-oxo acid dehydrogenase subunit E2, partial [Endozoicomonadaceae bacterium]|nr:2-oxo acid dehydrogenase subunit E2 [Endozoicomonadaceae bacterium]
MSEEIIKVPDIGGEGSVTEICINKNDIVAAEDTLVVLESDKASMEVPSPKAGKVTAILVKEGDNLKEGDQLIKLEVTAAEDKQAQTSPSTDTQETAIAEKKADLTESSAASAPVTSAPVIKQVMVPDMGAENVPVVEVSVSAGDVIEKDAALVTLESDKASMEVPSPFAGKVTAVKVKEGDKLSNGDLIIEMEVKEVADKTAVAPSSATLAPEESTAAPQQQSVSTATPESKPAKQDDLSIKADATIHAGPAVRRLAREFGVDLAKVTGTAAKGRIVKEDVQKYVKEQLQSPSSGTSVAGIPAVPAVDFSKWGAIEEKPLTRLKTIAAQNFQRSWLNVPHVTQFDEADITELEIFRKSQKEQAQAKGIKLTPLPFLLKACSYALEEMPQFCASLSADGKKLIYKKYIHIGVAVDTPEGLLVPVVKDVNRKGLYELA